MTDQEKFAVIKADFESKYGIDVNSRTRDQWKALVAFYGMNTVCATDKMTPKEVNKKMKHG